MVVKKCEELKLDQVKYASFYAHGGKSVRGSVYGHEPSPLSQTV